MTENDKTSIGPPGEDAGGQQDDKRLGDMARREFLEKCGTFAAVTPPAIMAMMTVAPKRASAAPSTFPGVGWGTGGDPPDIPGQHPQSGG